MSSIIESRNIRTDLEMFSDGFKVGNKDLATIIEKLVPIVDEAYSVMSNYLDNNLNNNELKDAVSGEDTTVNETNILSVEENM